MHPRAILLHLGDGTLGPRGVDLAEEEPRQLVRMDLGHRW
jgi:hypothetical protein